MKWNKRNCQKCVTFFRCFIFASVILRIGIDTVKVLPFPGVLRTSTLPLWAFTMC